MKKLTLYIIVFFLAKSSVAQIQLSGTVYDSTKRNLVMDVQVICTCGTMSFTDSAGNYSIYVGAKDSVFFFFNNRPTQKFSVASIRDMAAFDISIQMHVPGRYKQLKEIIVYGKNRRQDSIDNRVQYDKVFNFDKGGVRFSGSNPEAGMSAGIDLDALINVFRFRRNKSMARFQERLIREEQNKYVDYRFNKTIIQRLTTLQDGPLLDEFIRRYKPDYDILSQVIDIELFLYIQTAAKEFQKEKGL
ncbi:hypothetical protein [Lacibacter sp. H407]|uniref:hypothetical protein n=1 Tax=Lacibacter sp. H407 TaxID=3133423 RepID=UPI0030C4E1D7